MQRNGIIDFRTDAVRRQMATQSIALAVWNANRVLVPDMNAAKFRLRQLEHAVERGGFEQLMVTSGVGLAFRGPGVEVLQFHAEDRCLDGVESTVDADDAVIVPWIHSVSGIQSQ